MVDGSKIRTNLDREFTNFGQHFHFSFIPENEFWLDKEAVPDERRFFLDHLLVEWRMMKEGRSYVEAIEAADKKEKSERKKAGDTEKAVPSGGSLSMGKIHKRLLQTTGDKISIWLVHGRLVRSVFNIDFTEGGHDLVYHYVSKNEVWIDDDVSAEERIFVILHELYERSLMERGIGYPEAHKKASRVEWEARHNNEKLKKHLALLGIREMVEK